MFLSLPIITQFLNFPSYQVPSQVLLFPQAFLPEPPSSCFPLDWLFCRHSGKCRGSQVPFVTDEQNDEEFKFSLRNLSAPLPALPIPSAAPALRHIHLTYMLGLLSNLNVSSIKEREGLWGWLCMCVSTKTCFSSIVCLICLFARLLETGSHTRLLNFLNGQNCP